ncbi:carbamoyltransferase N-terminal domain-containing protein [Mycobacterium uberis]|uniref:carbamoyltransferase N-terminal domain-containing protein n=1 Tax=Mycobacterium uberis TaxID=2162698 RepID=UPI001058F371|nr:carbamoyltransferase N-terminal domain-containing protein [Mycobacterium uberis]
MTLKLFADFAIPIISERVLCVSNGVALDCVANGTLVERGLDLHFEPTPNDSVMALGTALVVAARAGDFDQR